MTDFSTNPGITLVDENGAKYGVLHTGNKPHFILADGNNVNLELDPLVKSVPTTDTFHHLGHAGKVFIHSDRHNGIAGGANFDYLIRIPAGNPARQVHLRFNYVGKAVTGDLDVDIFLYKEPTITDDGILESISSTNDAVVKTTGVLMFKNPTVTDVGTFKTQVMMAGEKKSAGSKEQAVPEWILAPDGNNARDYLFRGHNNGSGAVDLTPSVFFYDSEAA